MNWLKRIFCRHDWIVAKSDDFYWSKVVCKKCGAIRHYIDIDD